MKTEGRELFIICDEIRNYMLGERELFCKLLDNCGTKCETCQNKVFSNITEREKNQILSLLRMNLSNIRFLNTQNSCLEDREEELNKVICWFENGGGDCGKEFSDIR